MAYGSTSYGIISEQPRLSDEETHYNGEKIVFEADCDVRHLKRGIWKLYCCACVPWILVSFLLILFISLLYALVMIVGSVYCIFCSGPLAYFCGRRVSNSWRLLLTRSRIYYTYKHPGCECRAKDTNLQVDLDDICKIYVQDAKVATGCLLCTTAVPTTVVAELKQGRRLDLVPLLLQKAGHTSAKLYFTHCANAEEFVRAVEHQIQSVQTSPVDIV